MHSATRQSPSRSVVGSTLRTTLIAGAALQLASCSSQPQAAPANDKLTDRSAGDDWAGYGRTFGEQHFSPLGDINRANAGRLGLAWSYDLPPGNSASVPLAVDGILYFATGYSVVQALDATTGRHLWTYDPDVAERAGYKLREGWGIRGIAWWDGRIYTGTADGRLIAIDADSGKPVWSTNTVDPGDVRFISGAPRVFDGLVVIGHGGADYGEIRGYVTAYDARTGKQVWRFHTVPGDPAKGFESDAMAMAARTWSGDWWKKGGGGTVWNAMTYDEEQDLIYIGTGNGAPWNYQVRSQGKGDNLFLSSIVALDARTGKYRWHYQVNPGESWDYNAAMDMALGELRIGGRIRKVLMTAPKDGFFYVIDRTTGRLISAEPIAHVSWASRIDIKSGRPVEVAGSKLQGDKTFVLSPSPVGAHSWEPMAYNPRTRLAYIPTIELSVGLDEKGIDPRSWRRAPGTALDNGVNITLKPDGLPADNGTSSLLAWDPVAQKAAWRVPTPGIVNGGIATSAGGLVFQGDVDGWFNAYDASNGKRLWRFQTQAPIMGAPIIYRAQGRQYITVLTGASTTGANFAVLTPERPLTPMTQPRRVLTFVLRGNAKLAALPPLTRLDFSAGGGEAPLGNSQNGASLFQLHCSTCHGFAAVSGGNAPDLRASPARLSGDAFESIVRGGELVTGGMPRFEDLSPQQLDDIRAYLALTAAEAQATKSVGTNAQRSRGSKR